MISGVEALIAGPLGERNNLGEISHPAWGYYWDLRYVHMPTPYYKFISIHRDRITLPDPDLIQQNVMAPSFPPLSTPEPTIIFNSLDHEVAFETGVAVREHFLNAYPAAGEPGGPGIVIQIQLFNGHVLFASAVGPGPVVGPSNWGWVKAKFETVKKSGMSSWGLKMR
jgi:hypothetical protein